MRRESPTRHTGFTLIELVVAMAISSIVVVFVALFMQAPIDAFEDHSRRATLTADAAAAWPLMEAELRTALPNSLRARRNGSFVALEMLSVDGWARYRSLPSMDFNTAGTLPDMAPNTTHYLSVNNTGTGLTNAYTSTGSITPAGMTIRVDAGAITGESWIRTSAPPVFVGASPTRRIYVVDTPVTFLCDETAGTLHRYQDYPIAALHTARDSPAEFAALGVAGTLIARGLTSCAMNASPIDPLYPAVPQTASVRFTVARNGDSVTLLHEARAEYMP